MDVAREAGHLADDEVARGASHELVDPRAVGERELLLRDEGLDGLAGETGARGRLPRPDETEHRLAGRIAGA